jgi:hypothetical protein
MQEPIRITVSGVLTDLQNGYTRTTSDKQYQGEGKSIEEKYGLNKSQVSDLFKHDKLKGKKTIVPKKPAFILVDDEDEDGVDSMEATPTGTGLHSEMDAGPTDTEAVTELATDNTDSTDMETVQESDPIAEVETASETSDESTTTEDPAWM